MKPINEKTRVLPSGTDSEYAPSISVAVPIVEPWTDTVTPGIGVPFSSVTCPVTVISRLSDWIKGVGSATTVPKPTDSKRNMVNKQQRGIRPEVKVSVFIGRYLAFN